MRELKGRLLKMGAARSRDERGQSTVEFALTLILMMAFLLFYLQLSMVFAFGNYAHYATFMAARAYLAAGSSIKDQQARAQSVLTKMLKRGDGSSTDRFPSIAKGIQGDGDIPGMSMSPPEQFKQSDPNFSWLQGVRYTFRSKLFVLPLTGNLNGPAQTNNLNSVTLTSESWLGKEPSYEDCQKDMQPMSGIFDNGC